MHPSPDVPKDFIITPELTLPADADARRLAFVGMSGSGKTSSAKVIVEHLAKAGRRVAIVDPAGVWGGIRTSSDGKGPGLPFIVFGGRSADVPLEVDAGAAVADLVMEDNLPVILDLSAFEDDASLCRVAGDFIRRLRFLQNSSREPLLLVVDEADLIAPQNARKEQVHSQRALINVARRSRSDGLGLLIITQRPAAITKDVLTQAEAVFLLRFAGYNDIAAVEDWIGSYLSLAERKSVVAALSSLSEGEAFVASPSWMRQFTRVQFPLPETFDSSATPKAGSVRREMPTRAAVDMSALAQRFTAAIEAERENDPDVLKKRITDLQAQLRDAPAKETVVEKVVEVEKIVEVPVLEPGQVDQLRAIADTLAAGGKDIMSMAQEILARVGAVSAAKMKSEAKPESATAAPAAEGEPISIKGDVKAREVAMPITRSGNPSGQITRPQQAILDTLASLAATGMPQPRREHVALFAGTTPKSSGYTNNLGALRTAGLIDYPSGGRLTLTEKGRVAARSSDRPLTRRALQQAWLSRLTAPQRRIMQVLTQQFPLAISRPDLAFRADTSATSSGFTNNLGALRSLGLVDYPCSGEVAATGLLFPKGMPE